MRSRLIPKVRKNIKYRDKTIYNNGGFTDYEQNEFRRIQEAGSRLSEDERKLLYGKDRSRLRGIRGSISALFRGRIERDGNGDDDCLRILKNPKTNEEIKFSKINSELFHDCFKLNHLYMNNAETVIVSALKNSLFSFSFLITTTQIGFLAILCKY